MNPLYLVVGGILTVAITALLYGVSRTLEPVDEMDQRIEDWVRVQRGGADTAAKEGGSVLALSRVDASLSRRDFADGMKASLAQADLSITVAEYLAIRVAAVVLGFVLGFALQRNWIAGVMVAALGFVIPLVYVKMRQSRRLRAFNAQLPDVLDHLVGSLRAGYGLLQAVEWCSRQMPNPAGQEFDRVIREVQLGRGLMDALDSMLRRLESDDLALIITAIKIHHEVGGSLADILDVVAHTIRERIRIEREIQVLTAQQRYSGYVLMVLPIALGFVLYLLNPEYESRLFDPGPTLCIPIGAAIMMVIGFFAMRRIVDIEV